MEAIIDRLRSELALQSRVANEAAAKQREEIAEIYAKYNASEARLTRQTIEMKKACDEVRINGILRISPLPYTKAIVQARDGERERCDGVIRELRQRLHDYEASRSEVERRCEGYLLELRETRDEHEACMKAARAQAEQLQAELERVQTVNLSLRESLMNEQNESKLLRMELSDCKIKLHDATVSSKAWHTQLLQSDEERNRLARTVESLSSQVQHLVACRRRDFSVVAESLSRTVEREMQSLRLNMGIPAEEAD